MKIELNADDLRPLIRAVVQEVLAEFRIADERLQGKEVVDESTAADFLGLTSKQLRAIRRRGEIEHVLVSGRYIRYTRKQLVDFLERRSTRKH